MTLQEILDRCFDGYGSTCSHSCRRCGALVPTDRRELHLEFHHPTPGTSWKAGIPPSWARTEPILSAAEQNMKNWRDSYGWESREYPHPNPR